MQHHQLHKQVQVVWVSCHLHPPLWLWSMDLTCSLWKKDPGFWNEESDETSSNLLLGAQDPGPMTGCRARSTSLWVHMNLFWQLSRDGYMHGSGMSYAMTASQKPFLRAPWRMGDAIVKRGNAGWTPLKSGHPCPCQSCSQWPSAEKTRRGSLLNCPSCPPWQLNWSRAWTELYLDNNTIQQGAPLHYYMHHYYFRCYSQQSNQAGI